MIVCISTYSTDLDDPALLEEHFRFMDEQYRCGALVASGPRIPRVGGVIIARGDDECAVQRMLAEEPLAMASVAEYRTFPFVATRALDDGLLERAVVEELGGHGCDS